MKFIIEFAGPALLSDNRKLNPPHRITLSFDNGPDPSITPQVLDCLASHGVKATFFVLGKHAGRPECAALIRRALDEGHWVGNHTFSHTTPLGLLAPDEAVSELLRAEHAIEAAAGAPARLFRPYGGGGRIGPHLMQPALIETLKQRGYTGVLWNCVPGDWRDADGWLTRALADVQTRPWSLVVLHDHRPAVLAHLDTFINERQRAGDEFTQEFPPDCVFLKNGNAEGDLTALGA
jgi:peptidoglycan-N-acetylglucosamine deacetylase